MNVLETDVRFSFVDIFTVLLHWLCVCVCVCGGGGGLGGVLCFKLILLIRSEGIGK